MVPARTAFAAGFLRISALLISGSFELTVDRPRMAGTLYDMPSSRCSGEGGRSGFSKRRFKDGDVLIDGAAAHADARDQFAILGEGRSATH
jgi:hypothetical protein